MYRRNRYYDPMTGQFAQSDPIGIAGGLNVYGFANGDPVSYSDPYGLSAQDNFLTNPSECIAAFQDWLFDTPSGREMIPAVCSLSLCSPATSRAAEALRLGMEENPEWMVAGSFAAVRGPRSGTAPTLRRIRSLPRLA
jgi:uncharacterized protein RhaS with RHS repeats